MPQVPNRPSMRQAAIARNIGVLRQKKGWSFEQLAKALDGLGWKLPASSVYRLERGDPPRKTTIDELFALAEVFDVPVEDLWKNQDPVSERGLDAVDAVRAASEKVITAIGELDRALADSLRTFDGHPDTEVLKSLEEAYHSRWAQDPPASAALLQDALKRGYVNQDHVRIYKALHGTADATGNEWWERTHG